MSGLPISVLELKALLPVNERYRRTVDCGFYRLIHKSQRCDDGIISQLQYTGMEMTVQMKYHNFDGNGYNFIIIKLPKFKRALDSSQILEGATVWLFVGFMTARYSRPSGNRRCIAVPDNYMV